MVIVGVVGVDAVGIDAGVAGVGDGAASCGQQCRCLVWRRQVIVLLSSPTMSIPKFLYNIGFLVMSHAAHFRSRLQVQRCWQSCLRWRNHVIILL